MLRLAGVALVTVLATFTWSCAKTTAVVKTEPSSEAMASASAPPSAVPVVTSPTPTASVQLIDPNAPVVRFTVRDEVVGTRYHGHVESHLSLDASAVVKTIHSLVDEGYEYDSEVLALNRGTVSKSRVIYSKRFRERTLDGVKNPVPGVVEGRAYTVERVGEKLVIVADDGKPITQDEDEELRLFAGSLGRPDGYAQALALKPRRVGERLPEVELATRTRFQNDRLDHDKPGEHATLTEVTVTLVGTDYVDGQEVAILETTTDASGVQGGGDMTLKTHGKSWIRLDTAELVSTDAEGVSTFRKSIMKGSGTLSMRAQSKRLAGLH